MNYEINDILVFRLIFKNILPLDLPTSLSFVLGSQFGQRWTSMQMLMQMKCDGFRLFVTVIGPSALC